MIRRNCFNNEERGSVLTRLHETGTLDDFKSCPYNKSHVMAASRFQIHLVKCRKQNPEKAALIDICPYNNIHHVYKDQMEQHLVVCPQYHHFQRTVVSCVKARMEREAGLERAESVLSVSKSESGFSGVSRRSPSPPPTKEEQDYLKEWM